MTPTTPSGAGGLTVPATVTEQQADVLGVPVSVYERIVQRASNLLGLRAAGEERRVVDRRHIKSFKEYHRIVVSGAGQRKADRRKPAAPPASAPEPVFYADSEQMSDWRRGVRHGGAIDLRVTSSSHPGTCDVPLYLATAHGERHAERLAEEWKKECDAADQILLALGLNPNSYRSEGGSLMLAKIATAIGADAAHGERQAPSATEAAVLEYVEHRLTLGKEEIVRIRNTGCGNEWPKIWNRALNELCDVYEDYRAVQRAAASPAKQPKAGKKETCQYCAGSGKFVTDRWPGTDFQPPEDVTEPCDECEGRGWILADDGDAAKQPTDKQGGAG